MWSLRASSGESVDAPTRGRVVRSSVTTAYADCPWPGCARGDLDQSGPSTPLARARSITGMDVRADARGSRVVLLAVTAGALLSVALGVYGKVHTPTGGTIVLLGFDNMFQMKVWLA